MLKYAYYKWQIGRDRLLSHVVGRQRATELAESSGSTVTDRNGNTYRLRPATSEEQRLGALRIYDERFTGNRMRRLLGRSPGTPGHVVFVLEDEADVVGLCVLRIGYRLSRRRLFEPSFSVHAVGVRRYASGRGLGTLMLAETLRRIAKSQRDPYVYLLVASNNPAVNLYQRLGFRERAIVGTLGGAPRIVMVLEECRSHIEPA